MRPARRERLIINLGVLAIMAILAAEALERAVSRLIFDHEDDLKAWRRRWHPANSIRTYRLFGRFVIKDSRLG